MASGNNPPKTPECPPKRGGPDFNGAPHQSPKGSGDRRNPHCPIAGVGYDYKVGSQRVGITFQESRQVGRTDLFLTLQEHFHPHRRRPPERSGGPQMCDHPALVIGCPPAIHPAFLCYRLERFGLPHLKIADRLDVIVGVQQHGRSAFGSGDMTVNRGMSAFYLQEPDVLVPGLHQ